MSKEILNTILETLDFRINSLTDSGKKVPSIDEMRTIVNLDDAKKFINSKMNASPKEIKTQ